LGLGGLSILLGEGSGDEGAGDTSTAFSGVGQDVAHEVDTTALLGRAQHFADGSPDPDMGIGDD